MDWIKNLDKKKWITKVFSNQILTAVLIVSIILILVFLFSSKYYTRKNGLKRLFKTAIYSLIVTTGIMFLHDKLVEDGVVKDSKETELERLLENSKVSHSEDILDHTERPVIGQGEHNEFEDDEFEGELFQRTD